MEIKQLVKVDIMPSVETTKNILEDITLQMQENFKNYRNTKIDASSLSRLEMDLREQIRSMGLTDEDKLFTNNALHSDPNLVYLGRHILIMHRDGEVFVNLFELYTNNKSLYIVHGDEPSLYDSYLVKHIEENFEEYKIEDFNIPIEAYKIFKKHKEQKDRQ